MLIEYRKLIKFGNSSFVISVPNLWLKKNNLHKGDVVCIEEDGDFRLILAPSFEKKKEERKSLINTNKKSILRLKGEIYKAYTDGDDVIKLVGDNIDELSEELREVMNNLVAVEIVEQTSNGIIARNFLNMEDVSIRRIIRRIDIIIRSMFKDSVECIEGKRFETIVKRDLDVNRLCFMLERILKIGLRDPAVSRKINIGGVKSLHVWYIIRNMETIGDEIKRISRFLNGVRLNKKQKNEIKKLYLDIEKAYLDAMRSYYKNDRELAFDVSFKKDELQDRCNKFFEKNNISMIGGMMEKMKALTSWIKDIAMVAYE